MGRFVRMMRACGRRLGLLRVEPAERQPGQLAFASLAHDPGLLARLPREQARRLGAQAEQCASRLIREGSGGVSGTAAAGVIRLVRRFAARDALRGEGVDDMVHAALTRAPAGLGALLETIGREGPQGSESSAELASDAVLMLGRDGLLRIGRENADGLMRPAVLQSARMLRSEPRRVQETGEDDPARVLRIVEAVCAAWRILPLAAACCHEPRQWADHLVELWRDASTCVAHAEGGRCRPWEDARDGHAFGAVLMAPSVLRALVKVEAEQLARDARAAAAFVIRRGAARRDAEVTRAVEAARAVLVWCGEGREQPFAAPEVVRPSTARVRASLA